MGEKEVKQIYSEYRKIANKRAFRMAKAGFKSEFAGVYFPTISELGDIGSIRSALAAVSRHLRDPRSSLSGLKKYNRKMITTLHSHGYDFVTEENLKEFTDFMEWARARAGANDRVFKSDRTAELFEAAERKKINTAELKRNFERYMDQFNKTGKIVGQKQRRKDNVDSENIVNRFRQRQRKK